MEQGRMDELMLERNFIKKDILHPLVEWNYANCYFSKFLPTETGIKIFLYFLHSRDPETLLK